MKRCIDLYLRAMFLAGVVAVLMLLILSAIYGNLRFLFSLNGLFVAVGFSAFLMLLASQIPFIMVFRNPGYYGVTKNVVAVANIALIALLTILAMASAFVLDVNGY